MLQQEAVSPVSPYLQQTTASTIEVLLGINLFAFLVRAKQFRTYWPMIPLAMWQLAPLGTMIFIRNYGPRHHIPASVAYDFYYSCYWSCFAFAALCAVILTYTILHGAMAPLQGLQKLVKIVYFWAAAISLLVALDVSFTPISDTNLIRQLIVVQYQRATGIITVSLAIFVCLAIRPMGLSLKSRVFGTSLGLVIISVTNAFEANYLQKPRSLFGLHTLIQIGFGCLAQLTWIYYFAIPEPKRKFVLLATTSPFHRWNQIAEQFGQDPGVVAIGGIPPEAFAEAEMEVFHRASAKMNELGPGEETQRLAAPPMR